MYYILTATNTAAAQTSCLNITVAAITDLNSVNTTAIATVREISLLAITSEILENNIDFSDNEYIDIPLFVPHLLWQALILNPNSHTLSHPATMLIDSRCFTVLIYKDIASMFKLRYFHLHESQ